MTLASRLRELAEQATAWTTGTYEEQHDNAYGVRKALEALAVEVEALAETLRTDGGNRPTHRDCSCYACIVANKLAAKPEGT